MLTPIGCGSTYCFIDVRLGVLLGITSVTKGILAQLFFGGMFSPWGIGFDFCNDLDLSFKGQAVRPFFTGMGFPNSVKSARGFQSNMSENFINR